MPKIRFEWLPLDAFQCVRLLVVVEKGRIDFITPLSCMQGQLEQQQQQQTTQAFHG
jgi:hypothetical protein